MLPRCHIDACLRHYCRRATRQFPTYEDAHHEFDNEDNNEHRNARFNNSIPSRNPRENERVKDENDEPRWLCASRHCWRRRRRGRSRGRPTDGRPLPLLYLRRRRMSTLCCEPRLLVRRPRLLPPSLPSGLSSPLLPALKSVILPFAVLNRLTSLP